MKRTKRKNKVDWQAIQSDWKKQAFLTMLIIFVPSAIYLLAIGQALWFFFMAAVFYGLIKYIKSR